MERKSAKVFLIISSVLCSYLTISSMPNFTDILLVSENVIKNATEFNRWISDISLAGHHNALTLHLSMRQCAKH